MQARGDHKTAPKEPHKITIYKSWDYTENANALLNALKTGVNI